MASLASKRLLSLGTLVITSALLFGCGNDKQQNTASPSSASSSPTAASEASPSASSSSERVLKDAAGHEVKVPANPQRILAPFLEDGLTALGVKPVAQWGIGTVPQVYLQKQLSDVPVLNLTNGMNPEVALSYEPDLIVFTTSSWIKNGTYETYAKIAPTYVLADGDQDWRKNLTELAKLLNKPEAAEQALAAYDEKLSQAKEKIHTAVGEKTAAIFLGTDEKSFRLFGNSYYSAGLLYRDLGFKPTAVATGDLEDYSMEKLPDLKDADYIFVLTGEGRAKPPVDNILWKSLPAVKEGHVFEVDAGHWFNSNAIANGLIIDDVLKAVAP